MTISNLRIFRQSLSPLSSILPTFLLLLTLLPLIPLVSARSEYRDLLPNGYAGVRFGSGLNCVRFGHEVCNPITINNENNIFGTDFLAAGLVWTKELCEKDSDGDGLTNGQELGDPCCQWTTNITDTAFLRLRQLSNPGDASSMNDAGGCDGVGDQSSNGGPETQTETETEPVTGGLFASPSPTKSMSPLPSTIDIVDGVPLRTPVFEDDDDDVCFPASASVQMKDGTTKKMADISIGDIVEVAYQSPTTTTATTMSYSYSAVLGFSHRVHDVTYTRFVTIIANDGSSVTLTPGHFTYAPTLKRAREVRPGDRLPDNNKNHGEKRVVTEVLYDVQDTGLFNPHTESGTIVVNGLVQSCYTESVEILKAHSLLVPFRALWKAVPKRYRERVALDIKDRERDGDGVVGVNSWGLRMLLPLVQSKV